MNCPDTEAETCAYCGLPLAASWSFWRAAASPDVPKYCCTGCQFAAEVAAERNLPAGLGTVLGRVGLAAFLTLNVLVFTMALWTDEVYGSAVGTEMALDRPLAAVFRYLSLLLSLPVAWILGGPLVESAWSQLRRGQVTTDLLLALGVVAAFAYSTVSVVRGHGHVYFEVGCVVLLAVTIGRWLESSGKVRASEALDGIERLLPDTVRLVRPAGELLRPLSDVVAGDRVRVIAGERIPVDGNIVGGVADMDESFLTGESLAIHRQPGDRVLAGSLNLDGELTIVASAAAAAGSLQRLVEHVRKARFAKGYYQQLADRVTAVFLPCVVVIAVSATSWHAYRATFDEGLMVGLAVVLIACPCALALATPLATWSALSAAASEQVLFKRGDALERLAAARVVCFDKTGTLTTGEARVAEFAAARDTQQVLAVAATLAVGSNHPHSRSIVQFADGQLPSTNHSTKEPRGRTLHSLTLPGRGLRATTESNGTVVLGSLRFMDEVHMQVPAGLQMALQAMKASGRPLSAIGWQGQVRGLFTFAEKIRPEARAAISALSHLGLHVEVLTGDGAARAAHLSEALGLKTRGGLLPEEKQHALADLRRQFGAVVMVGDGVNDAPALAAADVGIALGCGADLSRDSADVCLLGNDLRRVAWSIHLARATVAVIRQNLFWAMIYNTLGIGLAALGWLNPLWASGAMVVSSLLVIGNSARLCGLASDKAELADPAATHDRLQSDECQVAERPRITPVAHPVTETEPIGPHSYA